MMRILSFKRGVTIASRSSDSRHLVLRQRPFKPEDLLVFCGSVIIKFCNLTIVKNILHHCFNEDNFAQNNIVLQH